MSRRILVRLEGQSVQLLEKLVITKLGGEKRHQSKYSLEFASHALAHKTCWLITR